MYLVKVVSERWKQPSIRGESIRIGSVRYYRNHEDPKVRDQNEGDGCIRAEFKTIDSDTFNKLMSYSGVKLRQGASIDANNCPIFSPPNPFNAYVFSCSYIKKLSELKRLKKVFERDYVYYIQDILHFSYAAADRIKEHLDGLLRNNPELISPISQHKIARLNVYPIVGRVKYSDTSKDQVVNEENLEKFDPHILSVDPYFQKSTLFANEKEVRIIWFASLGDIDDKDYEIISAPDDYLDIQIDNPRFSKKPRVFKESRLVNKQGEKISLSLEGR